MDNNKIYSFLSSISSTYPDFKEWFYQKVVPGLKDGTREIIPVMRYGRLIAVGIIKNTPEEKKICTIYVSSYYRGKGIGIMLFKKCMKTLGTDSPIVTVSENNYHLFEKIFNHFNFKHTSTINSQNKKEFIFNEL